VTTRPKDLWAWHAQGRTTWSESILSRADDEALRRFFAVGILLTVGAALGTDDWRVQS
jgi:hypothetical protein